LTNTKKREYWSVSVVTSPVFVLTIVIVALCAFVARQLWQQDISITLENRLLENTQIFFLSLATALHALQSSRQPHHAKVGRLCHAILSMLCLSIMIREIDIDKFGPQPGWALVENMIRLTGGVVWVWLLTRVYGARQRVWLRKTEILWTPTSILTGLGVLLYMSSWLFDKSVVPLPTAQSQLWEETLQMSGTVCLFTAALRTIALRPI
jgi:hypothetical protein